MKYVYVKDGLVISIVNRPNWRNGDGLAVTDQQLIEKGIYPLLQSPVPEYSAFEQTLTVLPMDQWEVLADGVRATYSVQDKSFAVLRQQALDLVNAEYTQRTQAIADGYPDHERESWGVQIEEANALLASEDALTPWIDAAAAARGLDRVELARRIKANDLAYRQVHGTLTGIRQSLEDQINAVADDANAAATLEAIVWPD